MKMGDRIRELRKEHNMTQDELGKSLGVGRSAILKYEKGEVENLPRSTIAKMATIFGVSPAYLMCFDRWDEQCLSDEVQLLERIQAKYGKDVVTLIHNYLELDDKDKETLLLMSEHFDVLNKFMNKVQGGSK